MNRDDITYLLQYAREHNASDLHLSVGLVPLIRVDGYLKQVDDSVILDGVIFNQILQQILPKHLWLQLSNFERHEIDMALSIADLGRFRVNIFRQYHGLSMAIRLIPKVIPSFRELGLTEIFSFLCDLPHGLILVTGPTGSGKSTTIAAMVEQINFSKRGHIITLEDPIEYIYTNKQCLIHQREVGCHTESFSDALRTILRQDPDFIVIGEMRDLATIRLALTAAETGHLVFATLHTNSAAETINRIVDVFPSSEKSLVRSMLAGALRAVISQVLVAKRGGGRVAAQEIMICTQAIKNMIREDRPQQIYSAMQTGQAKGMRTLTQHLQELVGQGIIDSIKAPKIELY